MSQQPAEAERVAARLGAPDRAADYRGRAQQNHALAAQALGVPAVTDGTPAQDPDAALHWAAVAYSLAEARTLQGHPLTSDERVQYNRYQDAARSHGITEAQVREYANALSRPAVHQ